MYGCFSKEEKEKNKKKKEKRVRSCMDLEQSDILNENLPLAYWEERFIIV